MVGVRLVLSKLPFRGRYRDRYRYRLSPIRKMVTRKAFPDPDPDPDSDPDFEIRGVDAPHGRNRFKASLE